MAGSAEDTVEDEALLRFASSFRYLHGWKSLDILAGIRYSCINKLYCLVLSWVSALPVQSFTKPPLF